jgi:UDP-N-acetylglucosamine 2-epimerase (non-hydrolysing)
MMCPIVLVIGTRPEGIKMAPVYFALKRAGMTPFVCSTAQHSTLLDDVFDLFGIKPDISLGIMKKNQDLFHVTESVMYSIRAVFEEVCPQLVLVHGDTTTSVIAAMSAFYMNIPVGHIEAGVRSGDIAAPFPEEANRKITSVLARYHFAPTTHCVNNLRKEGVNQQSIIMTGNTVVDALRLIKEKLNSGSLMVSRELKEMIIRQQLQGKRIILMTAHRRESFGNELVNAFKAIGEYAIEHKKLVIWFPMHPNPQVKEAAHKAGLFNIANIIILNPLVYHEAVYLLSKASCVITDSGGIQEEAASLGIPTVVIRECTDRKESIDNGLARLVGYNPERIKQAITELLAVSLHSTSQTEIYGDGYAADRIVSFIESEFSGVFYSEEQEHAIANEKNLEKNL